MFQFMDNLCFILIDLILMMDYYLRNPILIRVILRNLILIRVILRFPILKNDLILFLN